MSDPGFPRQRRITASADFTRSFAEGRRLNTRCFRVLWYATEGSPRLGLAVSRKVSVRAVVRNRIKRTARESFRVACDKLPPGDVVLVAMREAANSDPSSLRSELAGLWRKLAALPASHAQGTIRPATAGASRSRESTLAESSSHPAAERPSPVEPPFPSA
jgi:ribonuclease P protein component